MINKSTSAFLIILFLVSITAPTLSGEDGHRLWLRYEPVTDQQLLEEYRSTLNAVVVQQEHETLFLAADEALKGLRNMLNTSVSRHANLSDKRSLIIGTPSGSSLIASLNITTKLRQVGNEGFVITSATIHDQQHLIIAANTPVGALYGTFHFLRQIQTHQSLSDISVVSAPNIQHRVLNHWDNLDRTVERGYAGLSLWEWKTLPQYAHPRYTDYARANASLGINGTVINNVNANPNMLTQQYIEKAARLADIFRPYGIKVYFSANFFAPERVGGLDTSDPLDPNVKQWWKDKADQIYKHIPDFGGFLVKANSEGQPGPQNYGRTHAEGANVLAEAVAPHGGIVMWRAFVYSPEQDDRFREGYDEFVPLDGKFADNVILQVKNGPIDFQPREPFHPLFGALSETNTMLELQITQEYFGFSNHLAYMGPLYTEVLSADTYVEGKGSTVADVITGEVHDYKLTGIAGVANTGTNRNWTGHPFGQSNWYVFGRLAWDPYQSDAAIAEEWIRMTFGHEPELINPVKQIMMMSREAGVRYRSPLGLTHLYKQGEHYGPAPWTSDMPRPDWNAVYYHKADEQGIGFDRTKTGSNALEQYQPEVAKSFRDPQSTPSEYLLWFHHLPWDFMMPSGRTLWDELVHRYYQGVEDVRTMQRLWQSVKGLIDEERFEHVDALLEIQLEDAIWWRNACILYFQNFSDRNIPDGLEKPKHSLEYYKKLEDRHHIADF